jgi:peptidoglycan hydrolase-like protein with peptidoglycan-binding domain
MAERGWTLAVDGVFGQQTARVCRQFQAEKAMHVDGIVDARTWAAAWTEPVT